MLTTSFLNHNSNGVFTITDVKPVRFKVYAAVLTASAHSLVGKSFA